MNDADLVRLVERAPVAVAMVDREMRYIAASRSWIHVARLTQGFAGRSLYDTFPDVSELARTVNTRALAGETSDTHEVQVVGPYGPARLTTWSSQTWRESDGATSGLVLFMQAASAEGSEAVAIQESATRFRALADLCLDAIMVHDGARFSYANKLAVELFGANNEAELLCRTPFDFLRPGSCDLLREALGKVWADRSRGCLVSCEMERRDGARNHLKIKADVVSWNGSDAVQIVMRDVTAHKQIVAEYESMQRQVNLFQSAGQVGMWQWSLQSQETWISDQYCEIFGFPRGKRISYEEFLARVHGDDLATVASVMDAALSGEGAIDLELRIQRADNGETRWLVSRGEVTFDAGGKALRAMGVVYDVTERKRAQQALLDRSEDRYRQIVEATQEGIWLIDAQAKTTFVNSQMAELLGYTVEEMLGGDLNDYISPEWRGVSDNNLRKRQQGIAEKHDFQFRRKDGKDVWVLLGAYPIFENGKYVGALGMVIDNTERKRLEEANRQHVIDLRNADRQKDEFLATLAHELRNPLVPIKGALLALRTAAEHNSFSQVDSRKMLGMADRHLNHLVRLVDELLEVSRITQGKISLKLAPADIVDILNYSIEAVRERFDAKNQTLTCVRPENPLVLMADADRLTQVFVNLCDNAMKYTAEGGSIRIEVRQVGDEALMSVRDNGRGIPREKLASIFGLFVQLDGESGNARGSMGIGLALCSKLVHLHGGSIEARSEGLGYGSEFVVRLPLLPKDESRSAIH